MFIWSKLPSGGDRTIILQSPLVQPPYSLHEDTEPQTAELTLNKFVWAVRAVRTLHFKVLFLTACRGPVTGAEPERGSGC